MKLSRLIMSVTLALVISSTRAQEVIIKAALDTNRALIGDQLKLLLSVDKPAGLQVVFPVLKDTITREIEIISRTSVDTASVASGRMILSQELVISVFDTGFYEIPSLAFLINSGIKPETVNTFAVSFEILPVKSDSTIRDIKSNYNAPISMGEIYDYIKENYLYGLIALSLGLFIWFLVRYIRRNRGQVIIKETFAELPEVTALRELEKIKNEKPWMQNKVKLYYIRLSDILRTYIERRFNIMALEQTTDEILMALKPPVCNATDHNHLSGILKLADLVKFAKVIPGVNENAAQVDVAAEFVNNTTVHDVT